MIAVESRHCQVSDGRAGLTRPPIAPEFRDDAEADDVPDRRGLGVVIADLDASKSLGVFTSAGQFVPVAVNDAGTRVLMRRDEFGFGNADTLELWDVAGPSLKRMARWAPYGDLKGGDRDVKHERHQLGRPSSRQALISSCVTGLARVRAALISSITASTSLWRWMR